MKGAIVITVLASLGTALAAPVQARDDSDPAVLSTAKSQVAHTIYNLNMDRSDTGNTVDDLKSAKIYSDEQIAKLTTLWDKFVDDNVASITSAEALWDFYYNRI